MRSYLAPVVVEETNHGERSFDIYSRLLNERSVFLGTLIDDNVGQAVDIEIMANEMTRNRRVLERIVAEHTGQPLEKVEVDTDRDFILTANEAVPYGIVDEVIGAASTRTAWGQSKPSRTQNSRRGSCARGAT